MSPSAVGEAGLSAADAETVALFACPECRSPDLRPCADLPSLAPPFAGSEGLRCGGCGRGFPRVDGVWVLWSDALAALQQAPASADAPHADRVLRANIEIYGEVADEHGEHSDGLFSYRETLLFLKALGADFQRAGAPGRVRTVVDVGCGTGIGLDAGVGAWDRSVGVDISLANLRQVARKGYVAVLGDSSRLPFAPGTIDLVTCFAALHHFPAPSDFARTAFSALRPGGVLLTGCDPSASFLSFGPLARLVWDGRKPIYRWMSRVSPRFYMHRNVAQQERNDLAEHHRTEGGFSPEALRGHLQSAGFSTVEVFHGLDPAGHKRFAMPDWKTFLLRALSFDNPLRPQSWMSLSSLSRK